jgi:hypothetical protein
MKNRFRIALVLVLLLSLGALGTMAPLFAQADQQDYGNGGGSGGGGGCNYCNLPACGCANAGPGQILHFSCGCSSISCSRTCDYSN